MANLKKNYLYQAAYQLLLIIVPLVTTPYLSRVLGASQVGVYSYTYSIANYFVMFATLGMSTYGVREIAACGGDRESRSKVFWEMYAVQALVSAVCIAAYVVYSFTNPEGGFVVAAVWGMWVVSALLDVSWMFFGVEVFRMPTIRSIVTRLLSVAVIFGFVRGPEDLWIYCAAIAGSFLANQVLLWPFVRRYVDFVIPRPEAALRHLIPNLRLFIPVIAISFYVTLDKVMLGAMAGMTQVGYFEYSEKLSRMPMALVTAVGTVMLPRMTVELKSGNKEKALSLLEGSIWAMLMMAFAMMFGIIGIAHEFAPVFLGSEFSSCDVIMCVLALIIPIVSATNVLGRQYLLPTARDTLFTLSVCVGAVVNVCLNLTLIPAAGAMGAAVSTVCAEASVLVAQVIMTNKELPLRLYFRNAIPFAVCGFLMAVVIRLSSALLTAIWGVGVTTLALEICVGIVVYAALAVGWCLVTRNEHFSPFVRGVASKFRIK